MLSHYQDETGQKVWTGEGKYAFRFWDHWRLGLKALGEWVEPGPGREGDTTAPGGHHHLAAKIASDEALEFDAVSGASSRVTSDPDGHGRVEGSLSLQRMFSGEDPGYAGGSLRYSGETDFHSVMAGVNGGMELFQRNTALAGNVGGGFDYADPSEPPPGEATRWPTTTARVTAGAQLGQLLSARTRLGFSYAFSALLGPQESPYRRALVHTTLFPEHLPETRFRHVLGGELGIYLGKGVAFFHREGLYFDSWGVQAVIPETALPIEIGSRWMVTPRHRWYSQAPARFYAANYHELTGGWLSGDPRLGRLEGNDVGIDLEYSLEPDDRSPALGLSFTFSDLRDRDVGSRTRSFSVAVSFRNPD